MKKILLTILGLVIIFASFLSGYMLCNYNKNSYDVNNDGQVNSGDLFTIQKYLLNKEE